MSERYPLIKKCGLSVESIAGVHKYILADDLEELFAKGVKVEGSKYGWVESEKIMPGDNGEEYTHIALLINIQPIEEPDSCEKLVRDLYAWTQKAEIVPFKGQAMCSDSLYQLGERAKRLVK